MWEILAAIVGALTRKATDKIFDKVSVVVGQQLVAKLEPLSPADVALPTGIAVIPKGLRAFDEGDANFFLYLLPGRYRDDGLPESIHFWKTRIEATKPDTFCVGLIYGPSGCGKSSLVKAGLIPHLAEHVTPVYVEATASDTEDRLMAVLKDKCGYLAPKSSLRAALRRKNQIPAENKVLIVLDQFEQYLHATPADEQKDLLDALRECDGERLQCVVMVRDDFITPVTRFMKQLEIRLADDRNYAMVDLFDKRQAKKVLALFGQAFEAIPRSGQLTKEQDTFLNQAVSDLLEDDYVICVRLALFAQMVRAKDWTPGTLKTLGGAHGVGKAFLEESFVAKTAPIENRRHQAAAREVLNAMLPEPGTSIKGIMRSKPDLLEKSGYSRRPADFEELLEVLNNKLRLITPTDPIGENPKTPAPAAEKYYQLTHDYLVPSLREWLTQKRQETRRGRAELKLEERSALWNAKPENRHLPSLWEWGRIRSLTEKKKWTQPQRKMMGKAGRVHGVRSALVVAALVVVVFGGVTIRNASQERQNDAEATRIVQGLVQADTSQVKTIIGNLTDYRQWAKDDLSKTLAESSDDSNAKLHAALAILVDDESVQPFLKERLLAVSPVQFEYVRNLLEDHKSNLIGDYWKIAKDSKQDDGRRFQAACALASYDPNNEHWQDNEFGEFIAGHLVGVLPSELLPWRNALRPVQEHLTVPLAAIYRNDNKGEQVRSFATDTLADYLSDDAEGLFDLLADANEKQFGLMFGKLTNHPEQAVELCNAEVSTTPLQDASEDDKKALAMRQANAAVMLLRMNAAEQVWPLLKHSPDPRVRSYIIHWLSPRGGDPSTIIARYEHETDVTIKRALLLCLGEIEESQLREIERAALIETLLTTYRSDPDAGLHGAAEWLLRQWGQGETIAATDKELQQSEEQLAADQDKERQWYINGQGQTFVIFDADNFQMGSPESETSREPAEILHQRKIGRRIAISTKEVTKAQWREFDKSAETWSADRDDLKPYMRTDDSPMVAMTWYEAAQYCNWLSEQEGISEEQWCYHPVELDGFIVVKVNFLELSGYRLPTEPEWEFACRAGAQTSRYYGMNEAFLPEYAWYQANGDTHAHAVASLKPNDFGLFDMQGNVFEWCFDAYINYPSDLDKAVADAAGTNETDRRVLRGGSFSSIVSMVRSALRSFDRPDSRYPGNGFRPARTYHLSP